MNQPAKSSGPPFYRPELDCVRFLAFFAVFILHSLHFTADEFEHHGVPGFVASWLLSAVASGNLGWIFFWS